MRADSRSLTYVLYAVCPFCQVYRPITAMEFDRNLRFTIDLDDFPEFSRVRLWTLGIWRNAGMIRARSDPEWYPKTGVFEPCPRLSPRSGFWLVCRPPKFRDSIGTMVGLDAMRPSMDLLQALISRRRRRTDLGTIHLRDLTARARELSEMYGREKR